MLDAASEAVASPASTPARRRRPDENAVAVAPPPGTIFPTALPASWLEATTNQLFTRRAMRSSSHKRTKLPASTATARAAQYHVSPDSDREDAKTAIRLGSNPYREIAVTTRTAAGHA
jgi:hypothetical protein